MHFSYGVGIRTVTTFVFSWISTSISTNITTNDFIIFKRYVAKPLFVTILDLNLFIPLGNALKKVLATVLFHTSWKHKKAKRFSFVFRGFSIGILTSKKWVNNIVWNNAKCCQFFCGNSLCHFSGNAKTSKDFFRMSK